MSTGKTGEQLGHFIATEPSGQPLVGYIAVIYATGECECQSVIPLHVPGMAVLLYCRKNSRL